MKPVFTFKNYKEYLKYRVSDQFRTRGIISQMAKAANCQRSYLSQVLGREVQLTPDQALGLTIFWNFNEAETKYFLLLLDLERAASSLLKNRIRSQLEKLLEQQSNLKERLETSGITNLKRQQTYYSHWQWMAIHIIVSIPAYQHEDNIAKKLGLKKEVVLYCLRKLQEFELVEYRDNRWFYKGGNIHLDIKSPLNSINHNNWRQISVLKSQMQTKDNVHYTSVFSLSKEDYQQLQQMILSFIEKSRKTISSSKEEELAYFGCDFFKI